MNLKKVKETFANVFNNPNRITFREFLKDIDGEYDDLDFKTQMIKYPKLAKHILAMANTSGGVICFGIEETDNGKLNPIGLETNDDNTVIQETLNNYLPNELSYFLIPIIYGDNVEWNELQNKKFLLIIIEFTPEYIPFLPMKDYNNVFTKVDIFCRKNSSSTKCEYEDLKEILNKRIQTNTNTSLSEKDLNDLRILYNYKLVSPLNRDFQRLYDLKFKIILKKIK